ncbi:MAG: hypothetical protein AB7U38_12555 [Hyphomicrobiales bacterium]
MASQQTSQMPDYGEILQFLAKNPPQVASERHLHASLLELLANCLRSDEPAADPTAGMDAPEGGPMHEARLARSHHRWVHFN